MDHPTLVDFLLHGIRAFMHKFSIITLAVVESELIFVFTTKQAENISLMYRIMQKLSAFGMHIKMCGGMYAEIAVMSGIRSLENELDVNKMECKDCSLSVNDLERVNNFYARAIAPVIHKYRLQPFFNGEYEFEKMLYDKSEAKESAKAKSNPQPDGEQAPKRKRGRPRKVVQDNVPVAAKRFAGSGSEDSEVDEAFPEPRTQPERDAKSKRIRYHESYQNDDSGVEDFDVNGALDEINGSILGKRGRTDETTGAIPAVYLSGMGSAVVGDAPVDPVTQEEQADIPFGDRDFTDENGLLEGVDLYAVAQPVSQPVAQPVAQAVQSVAQPVSQAVQPVSQSVAQAVQPVVSVQPRFDYEAVCSKLVEFITSPGDYGPVLDQIMAIVVKYFTKDASPVKPYAMDLLCQPQLTALHAAIGIEARIMKR